MKKGVIPSEYREVAAAELHRELSRRVKRTAQLLAIFAASTQLSLRLPKEATSLN